MTFAGRLVDDLGNPLASPVNLELWIYDAPAGGTAIYAEEHSSVVLDTEGNFSVLLGTGADAGGPFPTFGPDLFAETERYIEVIVGAETLTPRVPVSSVPWAFIAKQANALVPDPSAPRFEDCGDLTIADHQEGLLWEKKSSNGPDNLLHDHNPNSTYSWSNNQPDPDGTVFTDFLGSLDDPTHGTVSGPMVASGCFTALCDWRLPTLDELLTIYDCSQGVPCVDPVFGETASDRYWSASSDSAQPTHAWYVDFSGLGADHIGKPNPNHVRAVRTGSCR
jgi:hypothetical protein